MALDKTEFDRRIGLIVGRGHIAWVNGMTAVEFDASELDLSKLTMRQTGSRLGVFFGDFNWWYLGEAEDVYLKFSRSSIGCWYAILVFLVLPLCRWLAKPFKWNRQQTITAVVGSYVTLAPILLVMVDPLFGVLALVAGFIAMLTAIVMAGSYFGHMLGVARVRRQRGKCRVCGYDLRATPNPNGPRLERCPECGTYSTALTH